MKPNILFCLSLLSGLFFVDASFAQEWSRWHSLNSPYSTGELSEPVVMQNPDGRLEIFTISKEGKLWHIWQDKKRRGGWSSWDDLGAPYSGIDSTVTKPVLAQHPDGRMEVFTISGNGELWHIQQVKPNGGWSRWQSLDSPSYVKFHEPIILWEEENKIELFIVGDDGKIWQTKYAKSWSRWKNIDGPYDKIKSPFAVMTQNADGRREIFVITKNNNVQHVWEEK